MKYKTTDELGHFDFMEAYIGDIQITGGFFHMVLDNVTIQPENSCNRDIRQMRTNQLLLKLLDFSITSIVEEGYKVYDADGKLMKSIEDTAIGEKDYLNVVKGLSEGMVCSLKKQENEYVLEADAENERTYEVRITASHDVEEWDRFLSKE